MQGTSDPQYIRQFKGCCRLVTVQLARTSESYDVDVCCQRALEQGKLRQDDVDFIHYAFALRAGLDEGREIPEDEARKAISRMQLLAANNLNCGDSA